VELVGERKCVCRPELWLEKNYLFSRAEIVGKELPHTHGGIQQPMHEIMNVGAFTLGYTPVEHHH
jgi:hypothetical protein